MHIFIDESGSFVQTDQPNSFSADVACVMSEKNVAVAEAALRRYKKRAGRRPGEEVKASATTEENYFSFLDDLGNWDGFITAVISDGAMQGDIAHHKEQQAKKIDQYVPVMVYDEGKAMIAKVAADVRQLSNQNYVELHCRAQLAWGVVRRATLYYSQRAPKTLGAFRWEFDAKDVQKNHFESTLADLVGVLSQTYSIRKPLIRLRGADYSHFDRFAADDRDASWFPRPKDADADNVVMNGKLFHEHMEFVDSKASPGVQIADLVANGLTRCLKGRFSNNDTAAALLGRLMIREPGGVPSLEFVRFDGDGEERSLDKTVARRVKIMDRNGKSMIAHRPTAQSK
ncbi:DUF3800 domain-containing protein [Dyella flagellata]|uniref:DUF3800 domain-containing protein n=1 Tax=Dyella flagellata TaxID=1867833 RepID=A0ABQ5X6J1_9GAMM|nr:DUF3800 domain-containing protein [Dyella flagellata]GLQ87236.1 hypothetical protein GCM10007898_08020 [Dyella flagellata]